MKQHKTINTKSDLIATLKYFGVTRAHIEENIDERHLIISVPVNSEALEEYLNIWKPVGVRYYVWLLPWWKCRFKKFIFKQVWEARDLLQPEQSKIDNGGCGEV